MDNIKKIIRIKKNKKDTKKAEKENQKQAIKEKENNKVISRKKKKLDIKGKEEIEEEGIEEDISQSKNTSPKNSIRRIKIDLIIIILFNKSSKN